MAVREVLSVRDARLREVSKPVTRVDKKTKKLLKDLSDTLKLQKNPQGVGLAAPQIGVNLRVFVMRHKGKILPVINPEIVKASKKTNDPPSSSFTDVQDSSGQATRSRKRSEEFTLSESEREYIMEGCLSLPHYYGPVRRAWEVELKYTKPDGQERVEKFKGFPAQIVQHEVDHLNGKIFIDRLFAQKRQLYELKNGHWHEVELP